MTLELPTESLQAGSNLLAVEVHGYRDPLGPTAFWTLDEEQPPWRDAAGRHPFYPVGDGWASVVGRVGGCVSNSASASTWLETPSTPALQIDGPFTVGGWFAYGWDTGDDPPSVALEKPGEFRLYYSGARTNRYRFAVGNVEVQDETPGTAPGQWRFVVAWFDGTQACIQIDQGPVSCVPAERPSPTRNPLRALQRTRSQGGFAMDEVFFYRRVLSAAERAELHAQGLRDRIPAPSTNLWFDLQLSRTGLSRPVFVGSLPQTLVRKEGGTAGFRLAALGAVEPIRYQWLQDGRPLSGATNALLFLSPLGVEDAGLYRLVASNAGGATTSGPIRLVVIRPPLLSIEGKPGESGWGLRIPPAETACTLWMSTNLVEWRPVASWPASAEARFWPLPAPSDGSVLFYRLELTW